MRQNQNVLWADPLLLDQPTKPLDQSSPLFHRVLSDRQMWQLPVPNGIADLVPVTLVLDQPLLLQRGDISELLGRKMNRRPGKATEEDVKGCLDDRPRVSEALRHYLGTSTHEVETQRFPVWPPSPQVVLGIIVKDVEVGLSTFL